MPCPQQGLFLGWTGLGPRAGRPPRVLGSFRSPPLGSFTAWGQCTTSAETSGFCRALDPQLPDQSGPRETQSARDAGQAQVLTMLSTGTRGLDMPFSKDVMPPTQPPVGYSWYLPSLFAAFDVVLLVNFSVLFLTFLCQCLAENREWAFPEVTGLLFVITFCSLISLKLLTLESCIEIPAKGSQHSICGMGVPQGLPKDVVPRVLLPLLL
ncbi:hypothetical protein H1C71_023702 [Ictidomys tridecemlineatus]|uniref:uncharacterized protein LOC120884357 isoform X1 n=1 Tax=Ictidomys tridecemlineatus TaxID=43179 RepID=UPI001A9FB15F|nr:uncharacterized protein LOC120884357 isoform X1 [Ictidomys tridecemlineatus]XP_040125962.1 uncharacterized protein LOC120884357 isoform X1 [Ictidomys tridecemlineatus]KAG3270946.1 hypothetical protein H1C71_023702 [Ictidomys tridecemlineatus]KAG3270947.1 hypothetical protein H1C71_023702 [Ictidomys tridecemlineatus]KAG3270948.1 hypothetical protein H1C71_023702 [Ictidomys tridecemlineatus]KAG3270949.1 hypothetical protein H1C71_023702 [Ictidomys tridecemlineatus]KAG3270950.1 hypothetical p